MVDNKKPYALRVDELDFEKFKVIAKDNHRSVNAQIEALIADCIRAYEAEHGQITIPED